MREITPVKTQRVKAAPGAEPVTPMNERIEAMAAELADTVTTLTEAVETSLTTSPDAPERQTALERVRAIRERLGRGRR